MTHEDCSVFQVQMPIISSLARMTIFLGGRVLRWTKILIVRQRLDEIFCCEGLETLSNRLSFQSCGMHAPILTYFEKDRVDKTEALIYTFLQNFLVFITLSLFDN